VLIVQILVSQTVNNKWTKNHRSYLGTVCR
jgi:hypothetical protein